MKPLTLGYSPCPNDTYIFYGLAHDKINGKIVFDEPLLEDVETLNLWAMQHKLDVTKLSYHALGHVLDDYCVLSTGSALGRGCGPLLVSRQQISQKEMERCKIAIPGEYTTAALLFRMFLPGCTDIVVMRFDEIMGAVQGGEVDAGVIIHESRFTYQEQGLVCMQDLGQWWEESSGQPIPLGCIAARRSLGEKKIAQIDAMIGASIDLSRENPDACLPYIKQHSQEIEQQVVRQHIGLYVNEFSRDIGDEGRGAIRIFLAKGREAGILPYSDKDVFKP